MDHATQANDLPLFERIGRIILWPGDAACNALAIKDEDSRAIFRMFVNTSIYAKISVGIVFALS